MTFEARKELFFKNAGGGDACAMNVGLAIVLILLGGAGGWIGWRRATKAIYRRSMFERDLPPGMTRRDYDRAVRRRRRIRRVFITLLYAIVAMVAGIFFLLMIVRH